MEVKEIIVNPEDIQRVGRKPKYNKKYCQEVINLASYGKTVSTLCVRLLISRKTYYEWQKKHPEFAEACGIAKEAYKEFWQKRVTDAATGEPCNTKILLRLFETAFDSSAEAKENLDPKSPININLNLEGLEKKKELTPEERRAKIEELKQELLEDKSE